jgi:adenylate kinase family enzyme
MKKQTDLGKKAKAMLLKGEAVPDSIVAQMINDKVNSPEVAHHGINRSFYIILILIEILKNNNYK